MLILTGLSKNVTQDILEKKILEIKNLSKRDKVKISILAETNFYQGKIIQSLKQLGKQREVIRFCDIQTEQVFKAGNNKQLDYIAYKALVEFYSPMKVLKAEVIMKKMEKNKQFDNLFKVNGVKTEVKIDLKISLPVEKYIALEK